MRPLFILLIIHLAYFITSCKKEEEEEEVTYTSEIISNLKGLDYHQSVIIPADYRDSQYAYADIKVVNNNELLVVCNQMSNIGDMVDGGRIIQMRSYDHGETWTEPEVIQENIAQVRTVSPSIVKITEQHLILIILLQHSHSNNQLYMKESFDGGYNWDKGRLIKTLKGFNVKNNGTVKYHNGTITIPVAYTNNINTNYDRQVVFNYESNDLGKTWNYYDFIESGFPLMEPGITFFSDGETLINIRTKLGYMYFARKKEGKKWSLYNSNIKSPPAPQFIHKLPQSEHLIMIWNFTDKPETPNRNPLSLAVSYNRGLNWEHILDIENSPNFDFSYSTMTSDDKYVYVTYYKRPMGAGLRSKSSLMFARFDLYDFQ